MFLKLFRNALGNVVLFIDWVSRPKSIQRSPAEQLRVQSAFNDLSLYQFRACPFCIKTRRAIHALGVDVELRDINKEIEYREELQQSGGRVKVPCLRIDDKNEVRWMYESSKIIEYLNQRANV